MRAYGLLLQSAVMSTSPAPLKITVPVPVPVVNTPTGGNSMNSGIFKGRILKSGPVRYDVGGVRAEDVRKISEVASFLVDSSIYLSSNLLPGLLLQYFCRVGDKKSADDFFQKIVSLSQSSLSAETGTKSGAEAPLLTAHSLLAYVMRIDIVCV